MGLGCGRPSKKKALVIILLFGWRKVSHFLFHNNSGYLGWFELMAVSESIFCLSGSVYFLGIKYVAA